MVNIFSPRTESELAVVVALLEAHGIRCFVQNAGFGGLYPGSFIDLYNKRSIMVAEEDVSTALELIKDFQPEDEPRSDPHPGQKR